MDLTVLDDVAHLFVEQYENVRGFLSEQYSKDEVALIRKTADKGEMALYTVAATLFGDDINQALKDAAFGAMDYIAYVDETWTPKDEEDKSNTLAMEKAHAVVIVTVMGFSLAVVQLFTFHFLGHW